MTSMSTASIRQILVGGAIGNLNEWYNFLLYGYLAPEISQLFFPTKSPLLSLTLTFTVFAISFFARPVGALLFGWIGDTLGRQRALLLSVSLMAISTLLIACLPSYQQVGLVSPILLCLFRICQGLSAGGEHTGSAIYLAEYAKTEDKRFWVSLVPGTASFGVLMSSMAALILVNMFSPETLLAWGWRIGYLLGIGLSIISLWFRLHMPETPAFKAIQQSGLTKRYSLKHVIQDPMARHHLWLVFCFSACWGVIYQILFIWMPSYLTLTQHFTHHAALALNSVCLFILSSGIIVFAKLTRKMSIRSLLSFFCVMIMIFSFPAFAMLSSGQLWQVYLAMLLLTLIFSIYASVIFLYMLELFHTEIRYICFSFGFNLGLALIGGTCPLIATWLIRMTGYNTAPAFYMMLAGMVALIALYRPYRAPNTAEFDRLHNI